MQRDTDLSIVASVQTLTEEETKIPLHSRILHSGAAFAQLDNIRSPDALRRAAERILKKDFELSEKHPQWEFLVNVLMAAIGKAIYKL